MQEMRAPSMFFCLTGWTWSHLLKHGKVREDLGGNCVEISLSELLLKQLFLRFLLGSERAFNLSKERPGQGTRREIGVNPHDTNTKS